MENEITARASKMLDECEIIQAVSVSPAGYPRVCAVKKIRNNGISEIYFSTSTSSIKTRHFISNPKASIGYNNDCDSVTLVGNAEIVMDLKLKRECFMPWMKKHFKDGWEDTDYCLIKFTPLVATIYIDGKTETIEL